MTDTMDGASCDGGLGSPGVITAWVEPQPGVHGRPRVNHPNLVAALDWALEQLEHSAATTAELRQAERPHRGVTLWRAGDKELLILAAEHAQAITGLLPRRGWTQRDVPSVTPLAVLRPHLTARVYNMLMREGFTAVEQVAALPDTTLLDIRLMGSPSITAIRHAIAVVNAASRPVGPVELSAGQVGNLTELLSILSSYATGAGDRQIASRADDFLATLIGKDRREEGITAEPRDPKHG